MINSFSRSTCSQLRDELNATLKVLSEKHGIDINIGNMSFDSASINAKVTIRTRNTDIANRANSYNLAKYGLPANAIGMTVVFKGIAHTITGINKVKRKYPIVTRRITDNQTVNFGARWVAQLLSNQSIGG
jgi:hypothetical protein